MVRILLLHTDLHTYSLPESFQMFVNQLFVIPHGLEKLELIDRVKNWNVGLEKDRLGDEPYCEI